MTFILIISDYDRLLRVKKNLRENNYLPSMIFLYRKSLFKIIFWQDLFNCQSIFKIFAAKTKRRILRRKYLPTVQSNKKISEKYHYQRLEITRKYFNSI